MANAYRYQENAIGFSKEQMLEDLALFLAYDASWTVHEANYTPNTGDVPPVGSYIVVEHDNGTPGDEVVIHIWENTSFNFGLNTSKGPYDNAQTWKNQPGARFGALTGDNQSDRHYTQTRFNGSSSILEYYFFGYASYVYVIYRTASDRWRMFAFGHIDKIMPFNGGGFACAAYGTNDNNWVDRANQGAHSIFFDYWGPNQSDTDGIYGGSQIRCDEPNGDLRYVLSVQRYAWQNFGDTDINRKLGANDTVSSSGMVYSNQNSTDWWMGGFEYNKLGRSPTDFSNVEMLVPIYIYLYSSARTRRNEESDIYTQKQMLIGQLPHVYATRIDNYSPGQEIDVQGSTFTVFPYARKTGVNDTNDGVVNSGNYGFIIEKLES